MADDLKNNVQKAALRLNFPRVLFPKLYAAVPRHNEEEMAYEREKEYNDADALITNNSKSISDVSTNSSFESYHGLQVDKAKNRHIFAIPSRLLYILLIANIATFVAAIGLTFILTRDMVSQQQQQQRHANPEVHLMGVAEIPVEMERYHFQTGIPGSVKTAFYGAPNASTDAAWNTILDAGLIKLTPEQALRLDGPTARNPHDPTTYVGLLEVFHELHCLHVIREAVYTSDSVWLSESQHHLAHCLEFLRQTLTCLADVHVSPIALSARQKHGYAIHRDYARQCRSFDRVHAWAVDEAHFVPQTEERGG